MIARPFRQEAEPGVGDALWDQYRDIRRMVEPHPIAARVERGDGKYATPSTVAHSRPEEGPAKIETIHSNCWESGHPPWALVGPMKTASELASESRQKDDGVMFPERAPPRLYRREGEKVP